MATECSSSTASSSTASSSTSNENLNNTSNDTTSNSWKIKIIKTENLDSFDGIITLYRMHSTNEKGFSVTMQRRYANFFDFSKEIYHSWVKDHKELRKTFPSFPSRSIKLFVDHFTPEFIEQRREALEIFMQQLILLPEITSNPIFLEFVGHAVGRRASQHTS